MTVSSLPLTSSPSGKEALSLLITQEVKTSQSLLAFYKGKYGLAEKWPFESFMQARDKVLTVLIHIRSYIAMFPESKDFVMAEKLMFDTFELFNVNKVFESK